MSSSNNNSEPKITAEEAIELAKRAFVLKKYEQSVEHYATALELITEKDGEDASGLADLYFAYGKALLENAISQNSVLGKDQSNEAVPGSAPEEEASGSGAFLSFSGDADEDGTVDLFGQAQAAQEEEEEEEEREGDEEGGEDDGEPEDDFNAAWEVLEAARAKFEKEQDDSDEAKLKLAEVYITLGDVSLETEKFEQAIGDYSAGLKLKLELLPISSRQIAEAHYKLSIVLDLSSGRLSESITHAEQALESVEARLAELRNGVSGQMKVEAVQPNDAKGKGKAGPRILGEDAVQNMTKPQMEAEIKELTGLKEDLALKVEELKTVPNEPTESAPDMVAKALDKELNAPGASSSAAASTEVRDLTSMVKKKKKAPAPEVDIAASSPAGKRKAEDGAPESPSDKKPRVEGSSS
ncbi:hypothetical protein EIP91_007604 [Steccherinum ochraceum]|uniref:Tetratricopeptide SHNi-TPR domain-containing protein n=1 Tax=Steccherinum ochraceum TaxID=92696 RepID=A0A4R0RYR8_9APHY|nr:hypothetical protein EIP91_007604 [Steccherinum ochraceum]